MSDYTYIFDFDYTLFKTYEEIKVWSPRGDRNCKQGAYFPLLPNEYQSFKLAEDEYLNKESFSEFLKVDWGRASPIQPVLEIFNLVKKKIILTARDQSIEPFIRKKILGAYDFVGLGDGSPNLKLNFIQKFKRPFVFEDSIKVVELCNANKIPNGLVTLKNQSVNILYTLYE